MFSRVTLLRRMSKHQGSCCCHFNSYRVKREWRDISGVELTLNGPQGRSKEGVSQENLQGWGTSDHNQTHPLEEETKERLTLQEISSQGNMVGCKYETNLLFTLNFIPCFYWKNLKHFEACRSCKKTLPVTEQEVIWYLNTWEIVFQCSKLIQWYAFVLLCCKTMFLCPADTDWYDQFWKLGQTSAVFTLLNFVVQELFVFARYLLAWSVLWLMLPLRSRQMSKANAM